MMPASRLGAGGGDVLWRQRRRFAVGAVAAPPSGSQTFAPAGGGTQSFTVPSGVTLVAIDIAGGAGGPSIVGPSFGKGGRVQAVLPSTPGDVWQVNVGGAGGAPAGGTNGGGGSAGGSAGAGGGGATDVRVGGTALANRKLVAGGAGGGGWNVGGDGGGTTAAAGFSGQNVQGGGPDASANAGAGLGGTPSAGGAAGAKSPVGPDTDGTAGSSGQGGTGGTGSNTAARYNGGGGGGGYFGGGGGGGASGQAGGGGGGSSYADPAATAVVHTSGFQSGDGYATLIWPPPTYDATVLAEPGLLYYWPMGTPTATDELVGGRTLTLVPDVSNPVRRTGVLPDNENATELVGTNTVAPASGYFTRTGESRMTIQAGMVLELVARRLSGSAFQFSAFTFNFGTWLWMIQLQNGTASGQVQAPGGQQANSTGVVLPAVNVWFHLAMRVPTVNGVGFNNPTFLLNGVSAASTVFNQGGMGTPGGNAMQIGHHANGDSGVVHQVAKCAVYSSIADANLLAHAHAMGLA